MASKPKLFTAETDLCAAFIKALPEGWTAYPETDGWDILLVHKDGVQVGIEAKLRLNTDVVTQVLEEYGSYYAQASGPDYRAVLVPDDAGNGFDRISRYIGFTIIRMYGDIDTRRWGWRSRFRPDLPDPGRYDSPDSPTWHDWCPAKRCQLPDYVPDVDAGAPCPIKLTDWKIRAIKIAVTLEARGFVTRADFKHLHIDHRRWLPRESEWLQAAEEKGHWIAGRCLPNFKAMHPRNYAEIAADREKWMLQDAEKGPLL